MTITISIVIRQICEFRPFMGCPYPQSPPMFSIAPSGGRAIGDLYTNIGNEHDTSTITLTPVLTSTWATPDLGGSGAIDYQWYRNGQPIIDSGVYGEDASYTINSTTGVLIINHNDYDFATQKTELTFDGIFSCKKKFAAAKKLFNCDC